MSHLEDGFTLPSRPNQSQREQPRMQSIQILNQSNPSNATAAPTKQLTKAEERALRKQQKKAEKEARKKKAAARQLDDDSDTNKNTNAKPKRKNNPPQKVSPKINPKKKDDKTQKSTQIQPKKQRISKDTKVLPQFDDPQMRKHLKKQAVIKRIPIDPSKQSAMFAHLPQFERDLFLSSTAKEIHPAILRLGFYYANGTIKGANARCVGMLNAFKQLVHDFKVPKNKSFTRELLSKLNPSIQYLVDCRPQSVSMGNTIRWLKSYFSEISDDLSESEIRQRIIECIDAFITHKIEYADHLITEMVVERIKDGDVLLTFGRSYVVEKALIRAHRSQKKFEVIIVDARPEKEGKLLLTNLAKVGVKCSYTLIHGISYACKNVTKVFLGASTVLSNGAVIARAGTATVALLAHNYRIPVTFCCETYKFSERVQIDAICSNEIGDPDDIMRIDSGDKPPILKDWRQTDRLKLLNLKYDLTPHAFVNMVITELGAIPPTSAPVIIREFHKDRQLA